MKSISPSNIIYPKRVDGMGKMRPKRVVKQTCGQLMGSPLSFPLLCNINLSVYRYAILKWIEKTEKTFEGEILWQNVLINGDDMLFRAPPDFIELFYSVIGLVGFIPSIGKNYRSSKFATINSRVYKLSQDRLGKRRMIRCGYLNQPLIFGKILHEGDVPPSPDDVSLALTDMCEHCPFSIHCLDSVVNPWNKVFPKYLKPNPYIPAFLGGYGISEKFRPEDWKLTRNQRRLATAMIRPGSGAYLFLKMRFQPFKMEVIKQARKFCGDWKVVPKSRLHEEDSDLVDDQLLCRLMLAERIKVCGKQPKSRGFGAGEIAREISKGEAIASGARTMQIGGIRSKLRKIGSPPEFLPIDDSGKQIKAFYDLYRLSLLEEDGDEILISLENFDDYCAGKPVLSFSYKVPPLKKIEVRSKMSFSDENKFRKDTIRGLNSLVIEGKTFGLMGKKQRLLPQNRKENKNGLDTEALFQKRRCQSEGWEFLESLCDLEPSTRDIGVLPCIFPFLISAEFIDLSHNRRSL
jgi:hypothetical protein